MQLTPRKINTFLLFKLPSAYFTGVRVTRISENTCETSVKFRWINQNPFNSMFWAVQGMAAELSTGALVMSKIKASGKNISMLVASNRATFQKKARGRIHFSCENGELITKALKKTMDTGEGKTFWMRAEGRDSVGDVVSLFEFEWTVKQK